VELEPLLAAGRDAAQEDFLERVPVTRPRFTEQSGDAVGVYTLVSLIGEGGMGAVWLAERADGELQQRVAVKLLAGGGRRPRWRERFLRERQLLASLNHPAIVRVMDAGHTSDGQPYLVMEYVDGSPIDVYASGLPLRGQLALFLHVCDAVAHAH